MSDNSNWTDAPDWSSGNPKNYDEHGKYKYGGGNRGGNSGCVVTLLVMISSGIMAFYGVYHVLG